MAFSTKFNLMINGEPQGSWETKVIRYLYKFKDKIFNLNEKNKNLCIWNSQTRDLINTLIEVAQIKNGI